MAAVIDAKAKAGYRPVYVRSLRQYLHQFQRGRESTPISSIQPDDIERWLAGRNESPTSRASNLGRLSALFSFAIRRGWIESNPCRRVERVRIQHRPPRILTVAEAELLLRSTRTRWPRALAWLTLGLFCGIRPAELQRLTWADVSAARAIVTVDAAASKTHRRRIVSIPPNAVEWLTVAHEAGAEIPMSAIGVRRVRRRLAGLMGWSGWPQDLLRHTAASYMLARDGDAGRVARQLGNSERMLLTHYQELTSAQSALEFFALTPTKS